MKLRGYPCYLGDVRVHAGSLHIYYDDLDKILKNEKDNENYEFKKFKIFGINESNKLREDLRRVYFSSMLGKSLNTRTLKNVFAIDSYYILRGNYNVSSF